jgi:protease-4
MLTVLGGISLFFLVIFFIVNLVIFFRKPEIPDFTILELDLDEEIIEYRPDETIATVLFDDSSRLIHLLEAIEKAGDDKRVSALVAKVGNQGLGLAVIQELRDAIITFRQKGKKAIAYADTLGEFGQANGAYYLASAFDEILIQPSGSIGLTGLIAQTPFIKGTLDMVGVKPRMDARAEYKNAMNTFTEDHYTKPHQEAMESLLDSWFEQMVRDIASNRGLKEVQVIDLFDRGLFTAQEAMEARLIDGLYYSDEVLALVEKQIGAEAKRLAWQQYLERAGSSYTEGKTIALIYGVGAVKRGKSGFSPVSGNYAMGSETLARAFRQAVDDEKVSAIIFRIDSPGGSYVASDTIWRETVRAKEKGIPVIVSMGNMAGSGGYFVSMAADKIVAQPATVTGSIGVFAGKMLTSQLWEKLGITWDEVYTSKNATFWTGTHDYTPEQWALFQSWMDHIYEDFTSKVAQGRKMPTEKVLEIAKGRIWSGEDALRLGLVDQLGGYRESIALAKKSAKIDEDEKIQLKEFPRKKSMLILLKESMLSVNQQQTSLIQFSDAVKMARPYLNKLNELGYGENPGVLSMTPWIE